MRGPGPAGAGAPVGVPASLTVQVPAGAVGQVLIGLDLALAALHFLAAGLHVGAGIGGTGALWTIANLDGEAGVGTWFAAMLLATAAALGLLAWRGAPRRPRRTRRCWLLLAAVAAFASVDEIAMFHERLSERL